MRLPLVALVLFACLLLCACTAQPSTPICAKEYTKVQQQAQADQENALDPNSPIAGMLLDYAALRKRVARYCN